MSDGDFLRAFQDRSIPTAQFHHGDHLRLAWLLLERLPFEDALDSIRRGLKNFALRTGNAAHYHETMTRGWMLLLAAQEERSFDACIANYPQDENPMLFFWSKEALSTDAARNTWVPPDLAELPPISLRWTKRIVAPPPTEARNRRKSRLSVDAPAEQATLPLVSVPQAARPRLTEPVPEDIENPRESLKAAIRDVRGNLPFRVSLKLSPGLRNWMLRAKTAFAPKPGRQHRDTLDASPQGKAEPQGTDTQHTMSSRFTWTSAFGKGSGWLLQKIVNGLALSRISPNTLTFIGLIINIVAAFFFGYARVENAHRYFLYAGIILIGAGLFDMVDGRVARQTNQVSVFGAFFDSVIDRYSDVAIFFGLLVYYARGNRFQYVVLVAFVMTASLMVSYTRARAEALIGSCKVGFMERPERIVLVILGALFDTWGVMAPALWVLAFLSTVTVIHRIRFTYTETMRRKLQPAR